MISLGENEKMVQKTEFAKNCLWLVRCKTVLWINSGKFDSGICCDDNWTIYRGGCYLFVKDRMPYKDAEMHCRDNDALLIVFNDVHEMVTN